MYKHFFRYDLYFQTNKGMLIKDSIVADDGETVITLNLKRGILSALQFPIFEADTYDLAVEQVTHFTLKFFLQWTAYFDILQLIMYLYLKLAGRPLSYFFLYFPLFWLTCYNFLYFPIIAQNSYKFLYLSG